MKKKHRAHVAVVDGVCVWNHIPHVRERFAGPFQTDGAKKHCTPESQKPFVCASFPFDGAKFGRIKNVFVLVKLTKMF